MQPSQSIKPRRERELRPSVVMNCYALNGNVMCCSVTRGDAERFCCRTLAIEHSCRLAELAREACVAGALYDYPTFARSYNSLPLPDGGKPRQRWRSEAALPRPGSIDLGRCGTYKPRDRGPLERSRCFPPSIGPARRRPLEAHLPTIEARPQAAPRLSRAHGDGRRPEGARTAPSQGAQASIGLGR